MSHRFLYNLQKMAKVFIIPKILFGINTNLFTAEIMLVLNTMEKLINADL